MFVSLWYCLQATVTSDLKVPITLPKVGRIFHTSIQPEICYVRDRALSHFHLSEHMEIAGEVAAIFRAMLHG